MVHTRQEDFDPGKVGLLSPVKPGKIICVGLNYEDHVEETSSELPEKPSLFFKPPSAVVGPGDPIVISEENRFDPEAEVAVVIGKRCRNAEVDEAMRYVRGFTGLNDVTNRDAQEWEGNWVRAKGFDTAAPVGPAVVPTEEIELPISFRLEVNGQLRQTGSTAELLFGIPELISEISSFMTLEKGDIISTGTPRGIAPIHPGDLVSLEIDGIGVLENPVVS